MKETSPTPEDSEPSASKAERSEREGKQVIAALDRAFERSDHGLTRSETVKIPAKILYGRAALGNPLKRSPKVRQQNSVLLLRGGADSGETMRVRRIENQDTGGKFYDVTADADRDPKGMLVSADVDGHIRTYYPHPQIDSTEMAAWIDGAYDAPFSAEDRRGEFRDYAPLET